MLKTYKYKLYNSKQNKHLKNDLNTACWVYNHCIALHKTYYRLYKKTLNKYKLQKHLTKLKNKQQYQKWNTLNSQTIQDITERIDKAYKQFFKNLKKHRPPKFKSRFMYKSITFKQCGFKLLDNNKIKIGGRTYTYWKSREINGKVKRVMIKQDTVGDFYLYLFVDEVLKPKAFKTGKIAGCDFGLKTFLFTSDNKKIESPLYLSQNIKRLRKVHRNFSLKKKGSNNRKKARRSLAKVHKKVVNQRTDFQFKLANSLIQKYDELYFETLNLEGMKKLWGRKVSDLALDSFLRILEWKALESGKHIGYIDRWFPSSKLCSVEGCGWIKEDLKLKDRVWECGACHTVHDRDFNASKNILRAGTSAYEGDKTSGIGNIDFKFCC